MLLPLSAALLAGLFLSPASAVASPLVVKKRQSSAPSVAIQNGTVEGLSLSSFSQEGAFSHFVSSSLGSAALY
jgi:ABC-type Mn2+/Zn2+ transport system permease subunit